MTCWFCNALAVVGGLVVVSLVYRLLRSVKHHFLPGSSSATLSRLLRIPRSQMASSNAWAVVTGASDGIGKGFTQELASSGLNLVLISRSVSKLEALAAELRQSYPLVKTAVLPFDFSAASDADYATLVSNISSATSANGGGVKVLINNVGINTDLFYPFGAPQGSLDAYERMVRVNILATMKMTHAFVQGAKLIVNVSSISGVRPVPCMATYSATKAFLAAFSTAMHTEWAGKCKVIAITPYYVATAMTRIRRTSMMVPSARTVARETLAMADSAGPVFSPHWSHDLVETAMGWLPASVLAAKQLAAMTRTTRHLEKKINAEKSKSS
eukprot:ANDGO_00531.mRNA.1 Very-long-chain 3-oxoacyl-CoA reductase